MAGTSCFMAVCSGGEAGERLAGDRAARRPSAALLGRWALRGGLHCHSLVDLDGPQLKLIVSIVTVTDLSIVTS